MTQALNGILVVDKPAGFTSHDVVAKMRGICGTKKIGHGGTLDPMATGVLPVFVGGAVKAVDLAPNQDKSYLAGILFGLSTDTGDSTGEVLEKVDCHITPEQLAQVLPRFLGPQMQTPPMYSAVKIDGKPLYKYAREGKEVARKARPVTIYSLEQAQAPPQGDVPVCNGFIQIGCSKGTYVRTLIEDIGKALGVPACMGYLRRTQAGVYSLSQAHTLHEIQAARDAGTLEDLLTPVELLFADFPRVTIDERGKQRLLNGAVVYRTQGSPGRCAIYTVDGAFLGLGQLAQNGELGAEKLFVNRPVQVQNSKK